MTKSMNASNASLLLATIVRPERTKDRLSVLDPRDAEQVLEAVALVERVALHVEEEIARRAAPAAARSHAPPRAAAAHRPARRSSARAAAAGPADAGARTPAPILARTSAGRDHGQLSTGRDARLRSAARPARDRARRSARDGRQPPSVPGSALTTDTGRSAPPAAGRCRGTPPPAAPRSGDAGGDRTPRTHPPGSCAARPSRSTTCIRSGHRP